MSPALCKSRDRLEVRTLRCGRNNPGSNPGHGSIFSSFFFAASTKLPVHIHVHVNIISDFIIIFISAYRFSIFIHL